MIDPTQNEKTAMTNVLQPLGNYVASIGMNRALSDYSREEIMRLIHVIVTNYQDQLRILTTNDLPFEDDIPF